MPWWHASRSVEGPSGRSWEIYVTRGVAPAWQPAEYPTPSELPFGPFVLLGLLIEIPFFVVAQIVWPLVRTVLMLPMTLLHGLRSRTRRIEAVSFAPHERFVWMAAPRDVPRVVDEIAAGLRTGRVARPVGATFLGDRDDER